MPAPEPSTESIIYQLDEQHLQQLHELYQNEWWTKGRSLEATRKCISHSQIRIGILNNSGDLIGFARVLTDFTFKALIFDVIVAPAYRDQGLGDKLVSLILNHEQLREVRSFELYCLPELMPFYVRHGFSDEVGAIKLMRRMNP